MMKVCRADPCVFRPQVAALDLDLAGVVVIGTGVFIVRDAHSSQNISSFLSYCLISMEPGSTRQMMPPSIATTIART
jgi:hypothetical protein